MAVIEQLIGEKYALYNGDCCEVLPELKSNSIGHSIYSPPFADLYSYSDDERDMSNCASYEEFLENYTFCVREVARVTMPGRLSCVHCMDLKRGTYNQRDFPGDIIRIHEESGFHFAARRTIWKDPWDVARRTRMKTLMHKQLVNDSSKTGVAGADYLLTFRKQGVNPEPIRHDIGLGYYAGSTDIPEHLLRWRGFDGDQRTNLLSHWIWRRYASSVWMDIRPGHLIKYLEARESDEEKHVCPLQLDVIERSLVLYSNPGDRVLTPFMGAGSEVCKALTEGRFAVGIELKPTYYRQAIANVMAALENRIQSDEPDLVTLAMGLEADNGEGMEFDSEDDTAEWEFAE